MSMDNKDAKPLAAAQVEAVARVICRELGGDPDSKEPGDVPRCDGRGYGNEKPGEYREPWHWYWRNFTGVARKAIRAAQVPHG